MISLTHALLRLRVSRACGPLRLSERIAQHSAGCKLHNGGLMNNNTQCPDHGVLRLLTPHDSGFCELASRVKKAAARTAGLNRPAGVKGHRVPLADVLVSGRTHRQKELSQRIRCHGSVFFVLLRFYRHF